MANSTEPRSYIYKDAPPQETVDRIRSILQNIAIATSRKRVLNNADLLFSLGLHIKGFDAHVSGKGTTETYALASAYAELAERLQNQLLFLFTEYRKEAKDKYGFQVDPYEIVYIKKDIPALPDEFKSAHIFSENGNVHALWEDTRKMLSKKVLPIVFVPFYDVRNDKITFLPRNFLLNLIGSNGMVSGNSPEEAISQGLSEIIERHVSKELYFKEIKAPTVPISYIKEHAKVQYDIIQKIERTGKYQILVKDCSLGKKMPAIAVVMILKNIDAYTVNIGVSPIWQIALERCLTEAFQGQQIKNYRGASPLNIAPPFEKKMCVDNHLNIVRLSKGQYPPSLFDDEYDYQFKGFPETNFQNQKEMQTYLLNLLIDQGHNIFIRDVSFLNFNAYHIIVPGMSVTKMLSDRDWKEAYFSIPGLDYLCRLDTLSNTELAELAEDIENFIADDSFYRNLTFYQYAGMLVKKDIPWKQVSLWFILALIYYKLNHFEASRHYMTQFLMLIDRKNEPNGLQSFYALRDFI